MGGLKKQHISAYVVQDNCMCREQYLIIFTGRNWSEELVEDYFYDELVSLQSSFNFHSISRHKSDLVDLTFNYMLQKYEMTHLLDGRATWAVFKVGVDDLIVDDRLDDLFRECVSEFNPPIYSTLFYFIERKGKAGFHRVSRALYDDDVEDDEHLDMGGIIGRCPALFYNHFYGNEYTDVQNAEIAKRMLVAGAVI